LMAGSGDEDAFVGEELHPGYCMSRARGVAGCEIVTQGGVQVGF
jgi:hypothetical protein